MTILTRPHVLAFFVGVIGILGVIVLTAMNHPIPTILSGVTVAAISGGLGLSVPSSGTPPTTVPQAPGPSIP